MLLPEGGSGSGERRHRYCAALVGTACFALLFVVGELYADVLRTEKSRSDSSCSEVQWMVKSTMIYVVRGSTR